MSSAFLAAAMIRGDPPPLGTFGPLAYVYPTLGSLLLVLTFLLPRFVPFPEISSPTKEVTGPMGAETVLTDPADARKKYVTPAWLLCFASCFLHMIVSGFALAAFSEGAPLSGCVALCGVATLASLTLFPRTADWKMRAEIKLGARFPDE